MATLKPTGIIRRIDDLGRVVITRDIRRQLNVADGDALEIYTGDGFVAFKKYVPEATALTQLDAFRSAVNNQDVLKNRTDVLKKLEEIEKLLSPES